MNFVAISIWIMKEFEGLLSFTTITALVFFCAYGNLKYYTLCDLLLREIQYFCVGHETRIQQFAVLIIARTLQILLSQRIDFNWFSLVIFYWRHVKRRKKETIDVRNCWIRRLNDIIRRSCVELSRNYRLKARKVKLHFQNAFVP